MVGTILVAMVLIRTMPPRITTAVILTNISPIVKLDVNPMSTPLGINKIVLIA